MTGAERKKDAVRRLFHVAAEVQRGGIKVDGRDPGWRALCREVEQTDMTEEEMRERLINLALVASEYEN